MFVAKSIPFDKIRGNTAPEVEILPKLSHPNIVAVREALRDKRCVHLVMEYCEGGSLTRRIERFWQKDDIALGLLGHGKPGANGVAGLPPWLVTRYLCQLLSAVGYMHCNRCLHRDIKGDNIMVTHANDYAPLRLVDFGCCCRFTPGTFITQRVGTLHFVAPEVLALMYLEKCDVWSCGVVAFFACVGYKPFDGITEEETIQLVLEAAPIFRRHDWQRVPAPLQELVREMLTKDPDERPSADYIFQQSPWLFGNMSRCGGCWLM